MNKLRFNDKELSFVAQEAHTDREGLLEKKGAVKGQGFRQRWFRLKGNLLFYFKIDDLQSWQSTEPLGVIVLERCKVEDLHSSTNPFGFGLVFNGDDTRHYILKAYSREDQQGWMKAIEIASYEQLKNMLYKLKLEVEGLTGLDPFATHKVFSGASPEKHPSSGLQVAFERAPSRGKLNLFDTPQSQLKNAPCYLLELCYQNVRHPISSTGGGAFSSRIHVLYASEHSASNRLVSIDSTEISETSSYLHMILLQLGPHLSHNGHLVFRLVFIKSSSQESKPKRLSESSMDCVRDGLLDKPLTEEEIIGSATCTITDILTHCHQGDGKSMTVPLSKNRHASGFLNIRIKQIRHNPLPPPPSQLTQPHLGVDATKIKPRNPSPVVQDISVRLPDIIPNIARECTWKHYNIPRKGSSPLSVTEELAESAFNTLVPLELLKCFKLEDSVILDEMVYNIGAISEHYTKQMKAYQSYLFQSVGFITAEIKQLEEMEVEYRGFKTTEERQDKTLQFLPTNMHIQRLHVSSEDKAEQSSYSCVTMGSPADHVSGHKNGTGLMTILKNLPSNPSFISHFSNYNSSSQINTEIDKLTLIRKNLDEYKNKLFKNCANANPPEMSTAFTGVSKEVQKLLAIMQTSRVLESVQDLVRARPGNPTPNITASAAVSTNAELVIPEDRRKLSMRKKLPPPKRIGCNCGMCSKCIPSPSDWLWNGSHYIQVSTGEWKLEDSTACIQELLVILLDKVEEASKKLVEQQHEAHAASTDNKLATFKPTYVWTSSLTPTFCELNQCAEGLIKLAHSSLSFGIMLLDSCIGGLFEIKKRLNIVLCQAVTGLVTSFYLALSENFTDTNYLRQLKTIGFLAQYECLLSSAAEDKGILEDMMVGVAEIKSISFQLAAISGNSDLDFRITGNRQNMIIHLLFNSKILSMLPDDQLRLGHPIKVIPCLVAYGMNNAPVTDASKKVIILQEGVNSKGLATLERYINSYKEMTSSDSTPSNVRRDNLEVRQLFKQLKEKYAVQKSRNIEFLINVHQLCRKLKGGRITTCRTGKDRSGMSVTLEECCLLKTNHNLGDSSFMKVLSVLRSSGTQLDNCFKNTGHRCYRFSSAQYEMLPRILQPPAHTCRQSVVLDQS